MPVKDIKSAQSALLDALAKECKKEMNDLNKGDKPDDKVIKLVVKTAEKVVKAYVEK